MRSAVDTNILSALWAGPPASETAERLLLKARDQGGLVICGAVYSELLGRPGMTPGFLDDFLFESDILVDGEMGLDIWRDAGMRFAAYQRRRRKSRDGESRRLLAGFVIGSHALLRADRLLTFNQKDYVTDYPELSLLGRTAYSPPRPEALS